MPPTSPAVPPRPGGTRPGQRLPPELIDMVVYQLPFHDLLSFYFVSDYWQSWMDGNDTIRKRMFRLPKNIDPADDVAREDFVNNLWDETYAKIKEGERLAYLWEHNHIVINPSFFTSKFGPHCKKIEAEGNCELEPRYLLDRDDLPNVGADLQPKLQDLWKSMFITYPPVTIARSNFYMPGMSLGSTRGISTY